LLVLLAIAVGCADVRDSAPVTERERAAAVTLIAQVGSLRTLADDPTDRGVLLDAVRFDAAAELLAVRLPADLWPQRAPGAAMPDCITASLTTATYTDCEIEGHLIDGTIARAGPRVTAEVFDVFILDAGVEGVSAVEGSLVLSGRSIEGSLDIDASWRHEREDLPLDASASFDAVMLDDQGCPTGGSVTLGGSLAGRTLATRTLHFGPSCGELSSSR
jgi:hypothetical protein